jgi:hypothetical protein
MAAFPISQPPELEVGKTLELDRIFSFCWKFGTEIVMRCGLV